MAWADDVEMAKTAGAGLGAWLEALNPDAVLLTGGADIGTDPVRDALDAGLMAHAQAARLPLLGICRGMQVMAHAAGAPLTAIAGHVATRHALSGEIAREVNSYHGQALPDVPAGYRVLARAPDGAIEAIGHTGLPWEGWMWHPEREDRMDREDISRFNRIIT